MIDHSPPPSSLAETANLSKLPTELSQVISQYIENRKWEIVNGNELNLILQRHCRRSVAYEEMKAKVILVWFIDEKPSFINFYNAGRCGKKRKFSGDCSMKTFLELLLYDRAFYDKDSLEYFTRFIQHHQYDHSEIDAAYQQPGSSRLESIIKWFNRSRIIYLNLGYDDEGNITSQLLLEFLDGKKPVLSIIAEYFEMVIPNFLIAGIIEILRQLTT